MIEITVLVSRRATGSNSDILIQYSSLYTIKLPFENVLKAPIASFKANFVLNIKTS